MSDKLRKARREEELTPPLAEIEKAPAECKERALRTSLEIDEALKRAGIGEIDPDFLQALKPKP